MNPCSENTRYGIKITIKRKKIAEVTLVTRFFQRATRSLLVIGTKMEMCATICGKGDSAAYSH